MSDTVTDNLGLGGNPEVRIDVFTQSTEEQVMRIRGADDQSFGMVLVQYPGSYGETKYDNVLSWGYNIGPGGPLDPDEHTFVQTIESRYRTESEITQLEYYYNAGFPPVAPATTGNGYRPFGITVDLETEKIDINFAADMVRFGDKGQTQPNGFWFQLASSGQMDFAAAASRIIIGTPSAVPFGLSSSLAIFADAAKSNTPFSGNPHGGIANLIGSQGYWGIRTGTDNSFNVDVYNGGTPLATFSILQNGHVVHRYGTVAKALASAPADPAEGHGVQWLASNGDVMIKITNGGVTKTATLVDFSAL
jgi:hypothetical protein